MSSILDYHEIHKELYQGLENIELGDVAHALGNICRWGGHTSRFYSVAEHALTGALMRLRDADANGDLAHVNQARLEAEWILHHDDAEAYVGDVITPIKDYLRAGAGNTVATALTSQLISVYSSFDRLEYSFQVRIAEALKLRPHFWDKKVVHAYDLKMLNTEFMQLRTAIVSAKPLPLTSDFFENFHLKGLLPAKATYCFKTLAEAIGTAPVDEIRQWINDIKTCENILKFFD